MRVHYVIQFIVYRFVSLSELKRRVVIEQTRFLSAVVVCGKFYSGVLNS